MRMLIQSMTLLADSSIYQSGRRSNIAIGSIYRMALLTVSRLHEVVTMLGIHLIGTIGPNLIYPLTP